MDDRGPAPPGPVGSQSDRPAPIACAEPCERRDLLAETAAVLPPPLFVLKWGLGWALRRGRSAVLRHMNAGERTALASVGAASGFRRWADGVLARYRARRFGHALGPPCAPDGAGPCLAHNVWNNGRYAYCHCKGMDVLVMRGRRGPCRARQIPTERWMRSSGTISAACSASRSSWRMRCGGHATAG
jgi:hypothetical protein